MLIAQNEKDTSYGVSYIDLEVSRGDQARAWNRAVKNAARSGRNGAVPSQIRLRGDI